MSIQGDSDFESDFSESEDDLEFELTEIRKKNENFLEEIVPEYSECVFFEHFRISTDLCNKIASMFERSPYYKKQVGQYGNTPALHQVLISLWYIGHQTASFRDVADRFDITISSVYRITHRVILFLSNLSSRIIKWPNENEKAQSAEHFRDNGFPNIIGAIDGTHLKIDKPGNDPESYINRKGYYSIQMQAVCDHRKKIIDVFIGYPGSTHDSRVFRNSPLRNNLEEKCGRYFLLGDSGYPLLPHLLTPYRDRGQLTRRQQNYNMKLSKNRYVIEHCFGILKQKFRQLYHIKLRNIRFIVHLIRAACVLHNIALDDRFDDIDNEHMLPDNEREANENLEDSDEERDDHGVQDIRTRIANSLLM